MESGAIWEKKRDYIPAFFQRRAGLPPLRYENVGMFPSHPGLSLAFYRTCSGGNTQAVAAIAVAACLFSRLVPAGNWREISPMSDENVQHDPSAGRFVLGAAVAEYRLEGNLMIFTHTWVPPELRGHGVAGKLIREGLEYARREGKRVVPQCSYVETYLRRHPEYADLRAETGGG